MAPTTMMACIKTGMIFSPGDDVPRDAMLVPIAEAEPYYEQMTRSAASPLERTADGRFDKSSLTPDRAYRLGRDYFAHCLRYGWPMTLVRQHIGPGGRILDVGCGAEIPLFRALTCDHSSITYYKPSLYVAVDLNPIKYRPQITGCESHIIENYVPGTLHPMLDGPTFDLVVCFEALEHMDKPDGELFLDGLVEKAGRRRNEGKPGIIALSTPVNGGAIAKNHIYEWKRSELRRAFWRRGCTVKAEYGTFANLSELTRVLTAEERRVWNSLVAYHSPHTLTGIFATRHPEAARNIAWHVEVP